MDKRTKDAWRIIENRYELSRTRGITLDGQPAYIRGLKLPCARVYQRKSLFSADFSWKAVERVILRSGGAFKAD